MKWFIDLCALLKWFIIGGKKPDVVLNKRRKLKRELAIECEKEWAKAEYQRHFRNAASNMGMSEEDVINMSNEMIQSVLFPFIPVNAEKFADSISKFIEQGGKLTFSINPQNPLPIISSMGLLVMPDLAIESLGIKLLAE